MQPSIAQEEDGDADGPDLDQDSEEEWDQAGAEEPEPEPEPESEPESIDDLGEQASSTPEIEEELADPVPAGGDSFFSGTETVEDEIGMGEGEESGEGEVAGPEAMTEPGEHSFEEAINEGSARLSVVGIEDDSTKKDLQGEFEEVFEAFQLGHYGNRVMHDYLLRGADDVNPVWGLAGSAMLCSVMVVYLRPDGDEVVSNAKEKLAAVRNGGDS